MKTISSRNRMSRRFVTLAFAIVTVTSLTSANGLDSLNMHALSSLPDGHCAATAVATVGGHNYLVAGCGSGIKVFDLSVDTVPAEVGKIALMGMAERIAVSGTLAYVTVLNYGLVIVDISAPRQPALRGMLSRNGIPHGVAIKGSYAYFTDESGGVTAVSVADPGNPTVAGSLTFGTRTNDIAIGGNYAYVANEDSGLQVVDLAAPAAPARAANCALPQYSWAVALSGHFAYVAVLDSGLQIVDIADPLHPKRTGSWKPDTTAADYPGSYSIDAVAAAGTIVYLSFNNKFWIIDVSDSSLPVLKSSVAYMPYTRNVISLSGSTAYVPGNYGIAVIGVLHPDAPIIYPALIEPNSAMCAKISGSTLYVGYGSGGLRSYDISNPLSPTSLARFDTTMNYVRFDATQNGDTLYAINGNNNLSILQVASTAITSIGGYSSNWFSDVVVRDSIACMTRFDSGLVLLNVANPASVKRLGSARVGGWVSRVRLSRSRNLAFVVSRDSGLVVVDIRDPANPVRIGLYKSSMANAKITDVAFSGTRAYVAAGYYGKLEIISLADSTHPTFLGRLATCYASAVEMGGGDTVIAAAGYQGTMVINAADSANPVVIGSYKNADWRYGSAQSNTQAVATGPNHVMVECNGVAGVRLLRFGPEPAVAVVPAPSKLQARATGIAKNSQVRIYEINGRLVFHGSAAMMRPFLAGLKGVRLYIVEFSGPAGVVRDVKCMTGAAMGALLR